MTSDEVEAELKKLGPPLFRFLRDERAIYDAWHGIVHDGLFETIHRFVATQRPQRIQS